VPADTSQSVGRTGGHTDRRTDGVWQRWRMYGACLDFVPKLTAYCMALRLTLDVGYYCDRYNAVQ